MLNVKAYVDNIWICRDSKDDSTLMTGRRRWSWAINCLHKHFDNDWHGCNLTLYVVGIVKYTDLWTKTSSFSSAANIEQGYIRDVQLYGFCSQQSIKMFENYSNRPTSNYLVWTNTTATVQKGQSTIKMVVVQHKVSSIQSENMVLILCVTWTTNEERLLWGIGNDQLYSLEEDNHKNW